MAPRPMKPQPMPPLAERERPGLSETLPHAGTAGVCGACGKPLAWDDMGSADRAVAWQRWTESDAWDRALPVLVVLCEVCAGRLIDPHPRLYRSVSRFDPFPGAMPICDGCPARQGWRCTRAKMHGGAGIVLRQEKGTIVHLNYGGGRGEWKTWRGAWPTRCRSADGSIARLYPSRVEAVP